VSAERRTNSGEREVEEAQASPQRVFARVSWAAVLPQLVRGARHYLQTLGWAEGRTHRPSVMEEHELVNTAYDRFASGQWTLPGELCRTDRGVVRVLSKAMFRVAIERAHHLAVAGWGSDDALDRHADDAPTPSRRSHERLVIERLTQLFQGDPDALRVLGGYAEGILDREDIREETGWSAEQLKVVLRRMSRRGRSAHLTPYDDRAEPESSGPQRRLDGTPEAGERQGSPPEHDRRARDAGRRR
jgi:hypothetical protein